MWILVLTCTKVSVHSENTETDAAGDMPKEQRVLEMKSKRP